MTKTYLEMLELPTYEERVNYLRLDGIVGADTFGHDRYLNQILYHTPEWKKIRYEVINRDAACDLALSDYPMFDHVVVHHINPITVEMILNRDPAVFDLNNLVCVSERTHNSIHYGTEGPNSMVPVERKKNDTCPWRK